MGAVARANTLLVFVNQVRDKAGVMFGKTETATGGRALRCYSSMRVEMRAITSLKEDGNVIGHQIKIQVSKNRLAMAFREAIVDIVHGKGVSRARARLDFGVHQGVIKRVGPWFNFAGKRLGKGWDNARAFLRANPDVEAAGQGAAGDSASL